VPTAAAATIDLMPVAITSTDSENSGVADRRAGDFDRVLAVAVVDLEHKTSVSVFDFTIMSFDSAATASPSMSTIISPRSIALGIVTYFCCASCSCFALDREWHLLFLLPELDIAYV
jgi:hypothetical protein